jgi:hypothetical protein
MKTAILAIGIAFLVGEYQTGSTKQCVYSGLGNTYTLTLNSYSLCPLSIPI